MQEASRKSPRPDQARQGHMSMFNHWPLLVCLFSYLAVTLFYGVTIPIFETPDAGGHYAYIHELTEGRGLPVQGAPSGRRVTGYVASHPPLYYALCAALTFWVPDDMDFEDWAWRNPHQTMGDADQPVNKNILIHTPAERFPWRGTALTMHIARFVSTLLGALAVVATYGIAMELFPKQRWLALGATALAAFNPMFVFTGARVGNDAAVTAFASLTIWGTVRLAIRGLSRRGLIMTGAALGLAALSKLSGVVLAPAVALALLFDSLRTWRQQSEQSWRQCLSRIVGRWAWVGLIALVVCGWWFARNAILYQQWMGVDAWLSHTTTVRAEPIGVLSVVSELPGLEKSYWAMFGWFNIAAAPWMYRFWWILVRAALIGLGLLILDQWTADRFPRPVQWGLVTLICALLLTLGSVWRFIMIVLGAQGRYLMPVVAPISILLMMGLGRLVPRGRKLSLPQGWPRLGRASPSHRRLQALAAFVGMSQLALALACLILFILPAYAKPEVVKEGSLPEEMTRANLSFGETSITLLGGHIEVDSAWAGDSVPLSLYWQASEPPQDDYLSFLQILGRDMDPVAGVDCYPGGGTFPPTLWRPGVIYRDRVELPVAAGAQAPTAGVLHAGLYSEDRERLPVRRSPDEPPVTLALLDRVAIRPREPVSGDVTHPIGARLGESITLIGYDLSAPSVSPGSVLTVTLVWHAEAPLDADYTGFLHLTDADGKLVGQSDQPPEGGAYPTSLWVPGDVVRDSHQLEIDEASASGACVLSIGMYNSTSGERLPAYGRGTAKGKESTRFRDDLIVVSGITIK